MFSFIACCQRRIGIDVVVIIKSGRDTVLALPPWSGVGRLSGEEDAAEMMDADA